MWLMMVRCIIPAINYGPLLDVGDRGEEKY
jgi:hypothetical protein